MGAAIWLANLIATVALAVSAGSVVVLGTVLGLGVVEADELITGLRAFLATGIASAATGLVFNALSQRLQARQMRRAAR